MPLSVVNIQVPKSSYQCCDVAKEVCEEMRMRPLYHKTCELQGAAEALGLI